jgi:hypothetical protein
MRDGTADAPQEAGPAGGVVPDRWQQCSGFSIFFDIHPGGAGRRARLYHEETGDETTFAGAEPTEWVGWILDRLGPAQPLAEAAGATATVVSLEIIDAKLTGNPVPGADDDSVRVELRLRVTGLAELHRMLGAKVAGVLFGSAR